MDANGAADESAGLRTAKACGPDTPALVSSWRKAMVGPVGSDTPIPLATVANKPVTGESTR